MAPHIQSAILVRSVAVSPRFCALIAHQGGWDEVLLITGPILVIAGLLILAKKRADAAARDRHSETTTEADRPSH